MGVGLWLEDLAKAGRWNRPASFLSGVGVSSSGEVGWGRRYCTAPLQLCTNRISSLAKGLLLPAVRRG